MNLGKNKIPNPKIKNARIVEIDGIIFRSKLEAYTYKKLKENNIQAAYEEKTFEIFKGFRYNGKKVRSINYTPDFTGENFIIEVKGHKTEVFKIKWKLFIKYLIDNDINSKIYIPRNQKDVDKMVKDIINEREAILQ